MRQGEMQKRPWPGFLATVVVITGGASAQDRPDVRVSLRCETYCSSEKLRTANARLTWIGPGVPLGPAPLALPGGRASEQLLETTVVKNGFARDLYASFPTREAAGGTAPRQAASAAERSGGTLRAYDLRLVNVVRPQIAGEAAPGALDVAPEHQETSVVVEGLEPGLRYTWRVRLEGPQGWRGASPRPAPRPSARPTSAGSRDMRDIFRIAALAGGILACALAPGMGTAQTVLEIVPIGPRQSCARSERSGRRLRRAG